MVILFMGNLFVLPIFHASFLTEHLPHLYFDKVTFWFYKMPVSVYFDHAFYGKNQRHS
jgi:hypothetical protein